MGQMYFIEYEVRPQPKSAAFLEFAGAYANCYVMASSPSSAAHRAGASIRASGWDIVSVETEPMVLEREEHLSPDGLAHFDQALQDGECYVFHTWPNGRQVGDHVQQT